MTKNYINIYNFSGENNYQPHESLDEAIECITENVIVMDWDDNNNETVEYSNELIGDYVETIIHETGSASVCNMLSVAMDKARERHISDDDGLSWSDVAREYNLQVFGSAL